MLGSVKNQLRKTCTKSVNACFTHALQFQSMSKPHDPIVDSNMVSREKICKNNNPTNFVPLNVQVRSLPCEKEIHPKELSHHGHNRATMHTHIVQVVGLNIIL